MTETNSPESVPMSAMTTGMPASCARPSTAGAVELSVGDRMMPATPRAMESCAFWSWVCGSLVLSSAEKPYPFASATDLTPSDT